LRERQGGQLHSELFSAEGAALQDHIQLCVIGTCSRCKHSTADAGLAVQHEKGLDSCELLFTILRPSHADRVLHFCVSALLAAAAGHLAGAAGRCTCSGRHDHKDTSRGSLNEARSRELLSGAAVIRWMLEWMLQ
jgi:hypothetical protein